MPVFKKTSTAKDSFAKNEFSGSNFIPYLCHYNKNTLMTKDNKLIQIIKVDGFSFETSDDEDLDIRKDLRNALYKGISSGNIEMYFHTIRRRKNIIDDDIHIDPNLRINNDFAAFIEQEWKKKYITQKAFINEHYITFIQKKRGV